MAEWTTAYVDDLPDSAFLYVEDGGHKMDGKTMPLSLRHFPVRDASGEVDLPHLRNALARIPQSNLPGNVKDELTAKAQKLLAAENAENDNDADEARDAQWIEVPESRIEIRDVAKREMDLRLLPWGKTIDTVLGPEEFREGAFDGTDPSKVFVYGPSHKAEMGLGQDGTPTLVRTPTGKGVRLWADEIGPILTVRMARTAAADDQLALAIDEIANGVSVEFSQLPGGTRIESRGGRRVRVHEHVALRGVTTTHRPAYGEQAAVLAMRSQSTKETPVPETTEAPVAGADPAANAVLVEQMRSMLDGFGASLREKFEDRLFKLEEHNRQAINIPTGKVERPKAHAGQWMSAAMRIIAGERIADQEFRDLGDLITSDNVGVVPPTFSTELIGVIAAVRPFMSSTRQLPTPATGLDLKLPKLVTRPSVATQGTEKTAISSTTTSITTATFSAVTKAGGGDISLQLLRRSSPEFLGLYLELLAEAYAVNCDEEAVADLLSDGGMNSGGTIDPTHLGLADAYSNSFGAIKRGPDSIWLSTAGYGAFLDANYSIGGAAIPLYPGLSPTGPVGGGAVGTIRNLNAYVIPALDDAGADAVIGPSRGFAWAEDGTYTLQVDNPGLAGRDIALVGMIWPCVLYGAAFTEYSL